MNTKIQIISTEQTNKYIQTISTDKQIQIN